MKYLDKSKISCMFCERFYGFVFLLLQVLNLGLLKCSRYAACFREIKKLKKIYLFIHLKFRNYNAFS